MPSKHPTKQKMDAPVPTSASHQFHAPTTTTPPSLTLRKTSPTSRPSSPPSTPTNNDPTSQPSPLSSPGGPSPSSPKLSTQPTKKQSESSAVSPPASCKLTHPSTPPKHYKL